VTTPGGPRRGRHSSDDGAAGTPRPLRPGSGATTGGFPPVPPTRSYPITGSDASTGGFRRSGLLDRSPSPTGPLVEPEWWAYRSSAEPDYPVRARREDERPYGAGAWGDGVGEHPSAPLPPRPPGVWDRLVPREDVVDEDQTVARPAFSPADDVEFDDPRESRERDLPRHDHAWETDAHPLGWEDRTGGLEVIGAHVDDEPQRRGIFRGRGARKASRARHRDDVPLFDDLHSDEHDDRHLDDRHVGAHASGTHYRDDHDDHYVVDDRYPAGDHHDDHHDVDHDVDGEYYDDEHGHYDDHHDVHPDDLHPDDVVHVDGEAIPVAPYDPRSRRTRRRRRPIAILISLVVLAGIIVGIVVGGQRLLAMIDPSSRDYTGQGTGTVQIRVHEGDTLSDIAHTLVADGVIASERPFVTAAEAHANATSVQPGVYALRQQMSAQSALDMLLNPQARLLSRVTVPEGLTVTATLARLAQNTGKPIAELKAAAANPAALGLPAYAHGKLEGFLFPATYDFDPATKPTDMLKQMVARAVKALDDLQVPEAQRLTVLTKASIVQAESGSVDDMGKVARVLENRLADGMPLQLDTTVNYANGKAGVTTSPQDRQNPSPYNTYVHKGLPPGAISNPGEEAIQAVLNPTPGQWRFFVVVNPTSGETRFAVTAAEHQQNVQLFQQWLRAHPHG
jgi:UPF0755 protein